MPQVIQFKRRIPGTGAPASGTGVGEVTAGEPAVAISAGGVAELYIGDGAAVRTLVSDTRQVELTGAQSITGRKTFTATAFAITPDGGDGDVLTTDGAGNVSWEPLEPGGLLSVNRVDPLSGNGTSASALGVTMATDAAIATGTNTVFPISPAGLRSQMGDDADDLDTTAKTVVPAINELLGDLDALSTQLGAIAGALRFVGNFDAAANEVTSADTGTLTVGQPLPAAAAANQGWFVIVTDAGSVTLPGAGSATAMEIGDWIVSTGTAWIHVPLYHTAITAANVGITAVDTQSWTNVQAALQGIFSLAANALSSVEVDDVSIIGDGTTGDPLEVAVVDGGTY